MNNCNLSITPTVKFMNTIVPEVPSDKHLGFTIGNTSKDDIITNVVSDFLTKVNMVKRHFKLLPPDIMYRLFKQYCMPLYGCHLFDLSDNTINKFYVNWRKSVRYLLGPKNTL